MWPLGRLDKEMKNPFKPQERVRVYTPNGTFTGIVSYVCADQDCLMVEVQENPKVERIVHFRQCRRLVKKKRREIWVDLNVFTKTMWTGISDSAVTYAACSHNFPGATKFREVKE